MELGLQGGTKYVKEAPEKDKQSNSLVEVRKRRGRGTQKK